MHGTYHAAMCCLHAVHTAVNKPSTQFHIQKHTQQKTDLIHPKQIKAKNLINFLLKSFSLEAQNDGNPDRSKTPTFYYILLECFYCVSVVWFISPAGFINKESFLPRVGHHIVGCNTPTPVVHGQSHWFWVKAGRWTTFGMSLKH